MQIAKIAGHAEFRSILIVLRHKNAEIVVPHIREEIISNNAINTFVVFPINDNRFQYFDQRKGSVSFPEPIVISTEMISSSTKKRSPFGLSQCANVLNRLSILLKALRRSF